MSIRDVTENDSWFKQYWRPAMAWQYFLVCLFDFLLFPLISMWWAHFSGTDYTPWTPISLKEGAFYHISMGAIIGISAWQRGQAILMRQYKEIKEEPKDE